MYQSLGYKRPLRKKREIMAQTPKSLILESLSPLFGHVACRRNSIEKTNLWENKVDKLPPESNICVVLILFDNKEKMVPLYGLIIA